MVPLAQRKQAVHAGYPLAIFNISASIITSGVPSTAPAEFIIWPAGDSGNGFSVSFSHYNFDGVTVSGDAASASSSRMVPLTDGIAYTFGLGVQSNSGTIPSTTTWCTGTVLVLSL